jgi:YegS/Rv2252/BmrU family lipid kinase
MNSGTCIILNPRAKGERAKRVFDRLHTLLPDAHFERTKEAGHARELARRACEEGYDVVIAAGGDGTVNEVVNGVAGFPVRLGILPIGTVNVFAMELGIPSKLELAVECILAGHAQSVDLAMANGRHFVQLAGVGLDAQTVKETDWEFKKALGPLSYVVTASQVVARQAPVLTIKRDRGGDLTGAFVLVGNGKLYGGPFEFFPDADMNDGLLDVCVFEKMSHFDLVRYFQGILLGRLKHYPDVKIFKTARLEISAEEEVPMEVDGELHGQLPALFTVSRSALRVIVPVPSSSRRR